MRKGPLVNNIIIKHTKALPCLWYQHGEFSLPTGNTHGAIINNKRPYIEAAQGFVEGYGGHVTIRGLRESVQDLPSMVAFRALMDECQIGDWEVKRLGNSEVIDVGKFGSTCLIHNRQQTFVVPKGRLFVAAAEIMVADTLRSAVG